MLNSKCVAAAVASLALVGSSAFGANILPNPDFESGTGTAATNWVFAQNGYSIQRTSETPHSGDYVLRLSTSGDQSANPANNANAVDATVTTGPIGGLAVTGTGWVRQNSSDPLVTGSAQDIEFRVYYYNSSGGGLGFDTATVLRPTDAQDTWLLGTVTGVAPAGTEKLAFQIIFRSGTQGHPTITSGAALVDDVSLQVVPEPASLSLIGLGGLAMVRRRHHA